MELYLDIFILIFIFFQKVQTSYNNEIIKFLLDNVDEENDSNEISLNYGKIQEDFISYDIPKYINFYENMLSKDLLIHIFSINCEIQVDINDNFGDPQLINKINNDSYSIKIIKIKNM